MTAGPLEVSCNGARRVFGPTDEVTVGRDPLNTVVLDDPRVSRRHGRLSVVGPSWVWTGLGRSGTFRDGVSCPPELVLDAGVTLRLGDAATGAELGLRPLATEAPGGGAAAGSPVAGSTGLLIEVAGRSVLVPEGTTAYLGRDPTGVLVVEDPRVGRRHLQVQRGPDGWIATDLDSSWGTWVDGRRVSSLRVQGTVDLRLASPQDGAVVRLTDTAPRGVTPPAHGTGDPAGGGGPARPGGELADRSVLGSFSHVYDPAGSGVVRIGRSPDNDVVIATDLTVSRYHAELRRLGHQLEVVDLRSRSGTFVNGTRIQRAVVPEGGVVGIGRHLFVLRDGRLNEYIDDNAGLVAGGLTVTVAQGRNLLEDVSLVVEPGQVLAVVGPTGAGKSTLLRALTGFSPATSGWVAYNGRDLYAAIEELRFRIGYVPQDDILHTQLPLRRALRYAAELRFSDDVSAAERDQRVESVLGELGLAHRADLPISKLSGGQRKRASVALELLTTPSLLFLDEPTSGLDPGFERSVMQLLRELADGGRTVVVITHAVASLELCDRVMFLAPGGRMAYLGPSSEALAYFGAGDYAEVFQRLESDTGTDWAARFRASDSWTRYVVEPSRRQVGAGGLQGARAEQVATRRPTISRQLGTLVRRNFSVLTAMRGYAALLVAQAPVIGLLLVVALGTGNLSGGEGAKPRALLMVLVVAACAMGLVNSCREVVRELPVYRRERAVGLSLRAYLTSKFATLALLCAVETAILSIFVVFPQYTGPDGGEALLFGSPAIEMCIITFLVMVATVAMGLMVSALVATDAAALVMIPVLIVAQLVLANAVLTIEGRPGLEQVSWAMPANWGFAAMAASNDLLLTDTRCRLEAERSRYEDPGDLGGGRDEDEARDRARSLLGEAPCSTRWEHTTGNLVAALFGLVGLMALYLAAAAAALKRRDPLRIRTFR